MSKHTIYKSKEGKEKIHSLYENYLQEFEVERVYVETTLGKTHVLVAGPREGKPVFIFQGGNCINPMTSSWFKPLFKSIEFTRQTRLVTQALAMRIESQQAMIALPVGQLN